MTKRRWMATMGFGAAVVVAGLATAAIGGPMGMRGNPERMEKFLTKRVDAALTDLKATDAQREKVNALKTATIEDMKSLMQAQKQARQEVLALWAANAPDAKAAHALVDHRIDAMRTLAHKMADRALALHATLTPEQRAQLAERAKRHHGPHGGFGHGAPDSGGK